MMMRLICILFSMIILIGCSKFIEDVKDLDWQPPKVVSVSPTDSDIDVPTNSVIEITFSNEMLTDETEKSFSLKRGNIIEVDGTFSWNDEKTVMSFQPVNNLRGDYPYTFIISNTAKDTRNLNLDNNYVITFTTITDELYYSMMTFGSNAPSFQLPFDILFINSSGRNIAFVADSYNVMLRAMTVEDGYFINEGSCVRNMEDLCVSFPVAIEKDSTNNIFVLDSYLPGILVIDLSINHVNSLIGMGDGELEFFQPYGLEIDSNDIVYVADSGNNRIKVFDNNLNVIRQFGQSGTADGEFASPSCVVKRESDDTLVVCDTMNHRLQRFTTDGTHLETISSMTFGNNDNLYPHKIFIDDVNNDYFLTNFVSFEYLDKLESFDTSVIRLTSSLTYDSVFESYGESSSTGVMGATTINKDINGNLYICDTLNNRIKRYDSSYTISDVWYYPLRQNLSYPHGIAIDKFDFASDTKHEHLASYVFVVDTGINRIFVYDGDGNFLYYFGNKGTESGEFIQPFDAETTWDNKVLISDQGNNRVQVFDIAGNYLSEFGNNTLNEPQCIRVDYQNNIWVTDENRVLKFDGSYSLVMTIGSTQSGSGNYEFNHPHFMSFDFDGNFFVSDVDNHRIQKYNSDGDYLLTIGSSGSQPGHFFKPEGLQLDPEEGFLYVVDAGNNRIQKFTSDGKYLRFWSASDIFNTLYYPFDMEGGNPYVYISEQGSHRIQKLKRIKGFFED